jgi:lytic murein transglycosylase
LTWLVVAIGVSIRLFFAALFYLAAPPEGQALSPAEKAKAEQAFPGWAEAKVWPAAKKVGVSRATFDAAFAGVAIDWSLPELGPGGGVPEGQAEFQSPAAYFNEKRLADLAALGKPLLQKWSKALAGIEKRYGVPAEIVVAIWGRESAYGRVVPSKLAINALATESYLGRRKETFFPELIAALKILERGDVTPRRMLSSWAGALGQTQFLPSKFLDFAVDFDGDGRADIWNSTPDVLASIAHYLVQHGWARGQGWGFEVKAPASVACSLEGPEQGRPLAAWRKMGVTPLGALPRYAKSGTKFHLLMPAGRLGPAFLVTSNFYDIKDYNNSDLYALFIGQLADRYLGGSAFEGGWSKVAAGFRRSDVLAIQKKLVAMGHDVGKVDGLVGFKTRIAIGLWQRKQGMAESCYPDAAVFAGLR